MGAILHRAHHQPTPVVCILARRGNLTAQAPIFVAILEDQGLFQK